MLIYPNAKINIGLRITEKRRDGYHNIETIFYPIPLMDGLEFTNPKNDKEGCQLRVQGAVLDGGPADNLVVRAYELLKHEFPELVKPLDIHLFKHIPTGAGLGGGSSDAAFTLRVMNERFNLNLSRQQLAHYATHLGADCPFFIYNTPMLAKGIGDELTPIDLSLAGKVIVVVKPEVSVSTKEAYADIKPMQPDTSLAELVKAPIDSWKDNIVNDFEAGIFARYPEIAAIKDKLYDLGAIYASMSGSGSSVYALFNEPVKYIDEEFSGYYCRQRSIEL